MVLSDIEWFYVKKANVMGTNCFPLDTWPKKMVHNFPILSPMQLNSYMFFPSFLMWYTCLCSCFWQFYIKWICKIDLKQKKKKTPQCLLILNANLVCWFYLLMLLARFCLLIFACWFLLAYFACWMTISVSCLLENFADWILLTGFCLLDLAC